MNTKMHFHNILANNISYHSVKRLKYFNQRYNKSAKKTTFGQEIKSPSNWNYLLQ